MYYINTDYIMSVSGFYVSLHTRHRISVMLPGYEVNRLWRLKQDGGENEQVLNCVLFYCCDDGLSKVNG